MYVQAEKSKENSLPANKQESRAVTYSVGQSISSGKQGFGFVDNRPKPKLYETKKNTSSDVDCMSTPIQLYKPSQVKYSATQTWMKTHGARINDVANGWKKSANFAVIKDGAGPVANDGAATHAEEKLVTKKISDDIELYTEREPCDEKCKKLLTDKLTDNSTVYHTVDTGDSAQVEIMNQIIWPYVYPSIPDGDARKAKIEKDHK